MNDFINLNERDINNVLHSLKFDIIILIDKYKKYRAHNVQYNNVTSIIS